MTFKWLARNGRAGLALMGIAVALSVAACASSAAPNATAVPEEVWLREENNGQRVQLNAGQTLGVDLESNPGTGFSWEVAPALPNFLQQLGEPEFKNDATPNRVGAAGRQRMRFKVIGKGESKLELVYHRPWEKDQPPAKTWAVTVAAQ